MPGGQLAPGGCGDRSTVSDPLAATYGNAAGYAVAPFEAYAVNGDVSNYLDAQGIPAISALLPDYVDPDWSNNLNGILAVLEAYGQ